MNEEIYQSHGAILPQNQELFEYIQCLLERLELHNAFRVQVLGLDSTPRLENSSKLDYRVDNATTLKSSLKSNKDPTITLRVTHDHPDFLRIPDPLQHEQSFQDTPSLNQSSSFVKHSESQSGIQQLQLPSSSTLVKRAFISELYDQSKKVDEGIEIRNQQIQVAKKMVRDLKAKE